MQPTSGRVFVKKVQAGQSRFELSGTEAYQVEKTCDVTACKPGDFILFTDYHEYQYQGETIIRVNESDIDGICTAK